MIRTRQIMMDQEGVLLAPYAQKSAQTAGRRYPEPPHPFRTDYQRDYARIIHSRAFRRLEYKTQVFLNGTGDHLRTRLTHTMEVVSITRCIARALGLNEDLAEAIALAHDLGHAPFGHSGEEALNERMREHGGFDHNEQSLRIVERIEKKYPEIDGLNLTFELLEGLQKHREFYEPPPGSGELCYLNPSLEAQVANLADEIAYYSHDLDDGLDCHLIHPAQLAELAVWRDACEGVRSRYPKIEGEELHAYVIRCIIDREVEDVITTSCERIAAAGVQSVEQVRRQPHPLVGYSARLFTANQALRAFLYANLYYHPDVAQMNRRACEMLGRVFDAYLANPNLLGAHTAGRIETDGLHRTVCDYLSGMTDRYLLDEYARIFPGRVS
ncbi:MAG: deoxyguanosinetriphosphate triphosphohydrolase [Chthoniobacteraceae bacterium]|nr:deoxyguanosinetriphosphate triphosphohydrolase [Chthoniobacteraceae bacterium]